MRPLIIGIVGIAGSGKSTVAEHLRDKHGFEIVSLAEPIKRIVGDLFGFTDRQLYGPSSARSEPHPTLRRPDGEPLTARFACQMLGTDFARSCCPNVWIEAAMARCRASKAPGVAIPDVRFGNEMEAIRAAGGVLWRRTMLSDNRWIDWLLRQRLPALRQFGLRLSDLHASEKEQLEFPDSYFDAVFRRFDSKDKLRSKVDAALIRALAEQSEAAE